MTRRRTVARSFAIAVALALVAASCGKDNKESSSSSTTEAAGGSTTQTTSGSDNSRGNIDGVLKLGTLLPESGSLAAIIDSLRKPVDMAVQEINAAGGVNGRPVKVASADDGTDDAAKAATGFDRLATSDKVDAILGPASSGTVKGLLDKIKSAGIVDCSGSATSAELTDLQSSGNDGGYFFRTAPPDKLQGPALADLVSADNKSAVALLVRDDSYGTGFAKALSDRFKANGVDVVANVAYDPGGAGLDSDVQKVASAKPDAVVLIAFPDDGGKVLSAMIKAKVGPADVAVYTADGLQSSSFYKKVSATDPSVVKGMKGTAPSSAPSGVRSPFIDKFKATGVDPIFSSYYYDCTMLIALAAQSAKSDDPARIKNEIPKVASGGTKCNSFAACKALLDKGQDIDFEGASGSVNLSALGEPTVGAYDIWSFDAAGKVQTEPPDTQIKIDEKDL